MLCCSLNIFFLWLGLLANGIKRVLDDPAFSISPLSAHTRKLAEKLLTWIAINQEVSQEFQKEVTSELTKCIRIAGKKNACGKESRGKTWSAYHSLRISQSYTTLWNTFISRTISEPCPLLCQYVGHFIFKELLKKHHPVPQVVSKATQFDPTYEEINGIRYAAGWVVRAVGKKVKKLALLEKKDLEACLCTLVDDTGDEFMESQEWSNTIDRGGLTKVNNLTFELFAMMEKAFRSMICTSHPVLQIPAECAQEIKADEDVQFVWCLTSPDWTEASSTALLDMLVDEWIKIRGFSYASSCVEKYKAEQRKTTQKRKGLRKQLQSLPTAKKSKTSIPEATQPKAAAPKAKQPKTAAPKAKQPKTAAPKAKQPKSSGTQKRKGSQHQLQPASKRMKN